MEVYVTAKAEQNFDLIFNIIKEKWGIKTAKQFVSKTDDLFLLLKNYPTMGPIENGDIRGFLCQNKYVCCIESKVKK